VAREYTISSAGITIAGATTLIFLNPGTTCSIEILRMWVSQSANNTSAQQRIQVETQVTVFPTLTTFTPAKLKCGINASAEGAGAKTVILDDAFNVLNGWLWVATPRETIIIPASSASGIGLYFPVAPATLTNWAFGLTFAELG